MMAVFFFTFSHRGSISYWRKPFTHTTVPFLFLAFFRFLFCNEKESERMRKERIMANRENVDVEYKRTYVQELRKDIIAFANTEGGTLYIGINDDGSVG